MGGQARPSPGASATHPCGARSGPCPSLVAPRANALSGPIRTRIDLILLKVSQKDEVSSKYPQKACHSPYIQNGPGKSPLGFLRFPFWPAFSHKELMTHFDPYLHVYCQNDEVSPDVHTMSRTRRGRSIPPRSPQQAALGDRSSLTSARAFS